MATTEDWATMETFADDPIATGTRCIIDLRRRVEALEQRAAAPAPAPAPEPAPAADRPLWEVMKDAHLNEAGMVLYSNSSQPVLGEPDRFTRAAEIDAVAEWFDSRGCHGAANALRAEARCTREGRRG